MPTLKNPRHESFARRVAEGDTSATGAYREGYASTGHGAEVNASKLLRKTEVQARIAELQAAAAKKTIVSVASLLDELEAARAAATSAEQHSAATSAIIAKAKLVGLMRERVEVIGGFERCGTASEVAAMLIEQLGDQDPFALLDELREAIERHLGARARVLPAHA